MKTELENAINELINTVAKNASNTNNVNEIENNSNWSLDKDEAENVILIFIKELIEKYKLF